MANKKAVILLKGNKYHICCDVVFLPTLMRYLLTDMQHTKELKQIFSCILEGLKSKKYTREPFNTRAMKPFNNRQNDRIICNVLKRKGNTQCIIMSEIFLHKSSNNINKELNNRYKIVSKYNYEIT